MNNVLALPSEVTPPESGRGNAVHREEVIRERTSNSLVIIVLAPLAVVAALYWARDFFIPQFLA